MEEAKKAKAIKEIKKHLSEKRLSVIVGAGFSKNASNKYLSWKELLHDMIVGMYGNNVKRNSDELNQFINNIISEKGYLPIASEYVKRHGFHEVIDQYIEDRTPIVKKVGEDDFTLTLYGKELSDTVDLSLHKMLKEIEWNNIYTFNYDNLLDVAAETNKYDEIETQIVDCRNEITKLYKEITKIENDIKELDNIYSEAQSTSAVLKAEDERSKSLHDTSYTVVLSDDVLDKKTIGTKKKEKEDKKEKYRAKIQGKKNKIERLREAQNDLYFLVDSAFKISLRKTKNIYKLHGNLRLDKDDKYGFDQDSRCQYIITQEDYDSYREKHEAFVSLMRIALLQDYFCLIGFSGDDPNFLSWIAWVKDIIDQRAKYEKSSNSKEVDAKIFFVDVSGMPLDKAKELFFKNHYIEYVPLLDKPGKKETISSEVKRFLESLISEKTKSIEAIEEYNSLWNTNTFSEKNKSDDYVMGYNRDEIRLTWNNREYNRLPKLSGYPSQNRQHVIGYIEIHIKEHYMDEDMAKLLLLASRGEMLPIAIAVEDEYLDKLEEQIENHNEILLELKKNRARYRTLKGKKNLDDLTDINSDESKYESILRMLFNLDFALAKKMTEEWETDNIRWSVTKFVIKKLFVIAEKNDLPPFSDFDLLEYNNQELLFSLQLLKRIMYWNYTKEQKLEIDSIIDKIKKPNLKKSELSNLDDSISYLLKKIKEQKVNISPYGDNRIVFKFDSINFPFIYSIQLLQHLIETAHPLAEMNINYFNKEDWYSAFKNIYEEYPAPCLFYSLQYGNDKKYLQKIAQDYIYSNKLRLFCEEVLVKMLHAYLMEETPHNIKEAILIVSTVFFTYVSNNTWQSYFEEIYKKNGLSDRSENRDIFSSFYDFIIVGLKHSQNKSFNRKVLYKTLKLGEKIDDVDNRIIIAAKESVTINKQPKEVKDSIDNLIEKAKSISNLFVIFNLQTILTKEQKSRFLNKLMEYDYVTCREPNMILASLRYGKGTSLTEKIKAEIIENATLWENGITKMEDGKYSVSSSSCLPLYAIQKIITFPSQTIAVLYEKMRSSLNEIIKYHEELKDNSFSEIVNPGRVVSEMLIFMEYNNSILSKLPYYEDTLFNVESLFYEIYNFTSIVDALVSLEFKVVNKGLGQLSHKVQYLGFNHFTTEYMIIANIILKRSNAGLSDCIFHFSDVVESYFKDVDKKLFEPIIGKILDVYQPYFSDRDQKWDLEAKKEMVEDAMISLNKSMKRWGKGREFWNNYQRLFEV